MSEEVAPDPSDKLIGQTLANRYQIEVRLGEGAMGAVYRAKHVKVGRAFAVKILHPRLLEDTKVLQRFEREAELAGRLRHPNVIGVVDVGETPDGMRYMVMDFAEGPDLASLLSEAPMPAQRIIHLSRQMLEGLFHAHEQGLIHRDFKPENVIIEKDSHGAEVPRIVDFGIAILREGGDSSESPGRLTTNGLVLGTPHYMAPEQAVADPIDHRIDLFALGIMVYEMLCGKLPFDGSGAEVARANLLLDPPPIAERVPYLEIDPLLEAFARRMMAKKRDLRPATAKVARDLLDLIERDRPAAAAALGVPLETARRSITTEDSAPVRHHGNHEGTFPPPIREALATPMQAPRMSAAKAVKARGESAISTQTSEPVKRSKLPMIAASIVVIGIMGVGAAIVFNKKDSAKPAEDKSAMATGSETGKPTESAVPDTTETKPVETGETAETKPVEIGETKPAEPAAKTGTKTATKTGTKTATKTVKPIETKPIETKPIETKPVEAPKVVDATMLATQYRTVGAQLKSLEQSKGPDATSDLRARYRFIRISDAMASQQKRDEASAILTKLVTDIATRNR